MLNLYSYFRTRQGLDKPRESLEKAYRKPTESLQKAYGIRPANLHLDELKKTPSSQKAYTEPTASLRKTGQAFPCDCYYLNVYKSPSLLPFPSTAELFVNS